MKRTALEIYDIFTKENKLSESSAKTIIAYIEDVNEKEIERKIELLAYKKDLSDMNTALKTDISDLKSELKTDISNLKIDISKFYVNIIKWMFIFWTGQIIVLLVILKFFFS